VEWPRGARPRRAGVSSFGISGTNAHVILEEPPVAALPEVVGEPVLELDGDLPFVVSGSSDGALQAQAARLRSFVQERSDLELGGVAAGLGLTRATLPHRAVALARDQAGLLELLAALERGESVDHLVKGVARGVDRVAFVFPGQASQWVGMGVELMKRSSVFASHMRECAAALEPFVAFSLEDVLAGAPGAPELDRVEVIHPALFAVMVSLARLWESVGVRPDAVVGHSLGEIAAAHVAGGLSLEDAARTVVLRSHALARVAGRDGAMLSIALSAGQLPERLGELDERVWLGVVNGPGSVVLSGDRAVLEDLRERCDALEIRARFIADVASHSPRMEAIRDPLLEALAPISPRSGELPLYSTVTGEVVDTSEVDAEHWYRGVSQTVLFDPAVRRMVLDGYRTFIEISPHPVLMVAVQAVVEEESDHPDHVAVIASLRRDDGGPDRFLASVAEAHVRGVAVDWGALLDGRAAMGVNLPSYAFQHRRYWLSSKADTGDAIALGQASDEHPLLGAMVPLVDGGLVLTGRLSLEAHPWLADHALMGTVLFPHMGFLELAMHGAAQAGCDVVEELKLAEPLVLDGQQSVQLQVSVSAADDEGNCELSVHSRPESASSGQEVPWILHASGSVAPSSSADADLHGLGDGPWPPEGAEAVDGDYLYDQLAEAGYEYGPVFQGVRAAYRAAGELYAEVGPGGGHTLSSRGFALHPALADGVLQATALGQLNSHALLVPSAFSQVRLYQPEARSLRLRIIQGDNAASVLAVDEVGAAVLSIGSLELRPTDPQLLTGSRGVHDDLYELKWVEVPPPAAGGRVPVVAVLGEIAEFDVAGGAARYRDLQALVAAVQSGAPAPDLVVTEVTVPADRELVDAVHEVTARTLALLQAWLALDALADSQLVLVTRGAVAVLEDEAPELAVATLPGLLRSAHSEHPDRFAVVDVDVSASSRSALYPALLVGERELALRNGAFYAPRIVGYTADAVPPGGPSGSKAGPPRSLDPDGTVLITGGTGGLGALEARHLAARHGARHLLLASRRGTSAPGATELADELQALGCQVEIVACDASDRAQLEALLARIPPERPLTAVVHAAGVLDDGVISSLDAERLRRVMAPKVDAAVNLDELTRELNLSEFILYSSGAGTLGSPGQGNYAAANTFLDALAYRRRVDGLPAISLAFGVWERVTGMTAHLTETDAVGGLSTGVAPLGDQEGLELIDLARQMDRPLLLPVRFDQGVLRARARDNMLPAILSSLVRVPSRGRGRPAGNRLASLKAEDRGQAVLELVREHLASALGYNSPEALDMELTFFELGIDSLVAAEFRNRINSAAGIRLPATALFEIPTPLDLVAYVRAEIESTLANDRDVPPPGEIDSKLSAPDGAAHTELPTSHIVDDDGHEGNNGSGPDPVASLFLQAHERGRLDDGIMIIEAASKLRPTFTDDAVSSHVPRLVRLSQGEDPPPVFVFSSIVATGGPHEYARFAQSFDRGREIVGVPAPGFHRDELLPASISTAAAAQAEALAGRAGADEVVLVGYSTGGFLAYATACRCADRGLRPFVVLIDTPVVGAAPMLLHVVCDRMAEPDGSPVTLTDARLTAMGAYLRMLREWQPIDRGLPTLLVQASDQVPGLSTDGEWQARWSFDHSVVPVRGDHFTIMQDGAEETAQAVERWLVKLGLANSPAELR